MKVYFTASLTGKKKYFNNYEVIVKTIERLGYKLLTKNVLLRNKEDVLKETPGEATSYYKKMTNWIKEADIMVAEISYPSLGVGYEVALSLDQGKTVIVLYTEDREPYLLESSKLDKLQVIEYHPDNLAKMLEEALEVAREQTDVRFNFFIPPKISAYLDWVAKHKKLPRAVFLRRLIEEHMRRNKDYKA